MTDADRLSNRPSGRMNGGRALAEMLRLAGVGPMFGMGGFQLLPFYDALAELGMRHFLINDERCGAFAAEAYARVTNRAGVCDGTLGPGATNLVTGLIEGLNAGTPMIALAGDTNRAHSWKNMTQECRQTEILRPAVKELIRVEMTSRVPELLRRAFAVATSGRPGPVLLDVPEDVCHGEHDFEPEEFALDPSTLSVPARRIRPDRAEVARAAALIARAKRPLLLIGGGIHLSAGYDALLGFAVTPRPGWRISPTRLPTRRSGRGRRAPIMSPRSPPGWRHGARRRRRAFTRRSGRSTWPGSAPSLTRPCRRTACWSPTAGLPVTGLGCSTIRSRRGGTSSRIAAWPRSAMGCRVGSGRL